MQIALTFLEDLDLYKAVKPYELHLPVPEHAEDSNIELIEHDGITATDVRESVENFSLESHGFEYITAPTQALTLPLQNHIHDMYDQSIKLYLEEVITIFKRRLECERVLLDDWRVGLVENQ